MKRIKLAAFFHGKLSVVLVLSMRHEVHYYLRSFLISVKNHALYEKLWFSGGTPKTHFFLKSKKSSHNILHNIKPKTFFSVFDGK